MLGSAIFFLASTELLFGSVSKRIGELWQTIAVCRFPINIIVKQSDLKKKNKFNLLKRSEILDNEYDITTA